MAVVVSVTPHILVSRASSQSARKKHKATAAKLATRHNSSNITKKTKDETTPMTINNVFLRF
jgi:hypothetical protein